MKALAIVFLICFADISASTAQANVTAVDKHGLPLNPLQKEAFRDAGAVCIRLMSPTAYIHPPAFTRLGEGDPLRDWGEDFALKGCMEAQVPFDSRLVGLQFLVR